MLLVIRTVKNHVDLTSASSFIETLKKKKGKKEKSTW